MLHPRHPIDHEARMRPRHIRDRPRIHHLRRPRSRLAPHRPRLPTSPTSRALTYGKALYANNRPPPHPPPPPGKIKWRGVGKKNHPPPKPPPPKPRPFSPPHPPQPRHDDPHD